MNWIWILNLKVSNNMKIINTWKDNSFYLSQLKWRRHRSLSGSCRRIGGIKFSFLLPSPRKIFLFYVLFQHICYMFHWNKICYHRYEDKIYILTSMYKNLSLKTTQNTLWATSILFFGMTFKRKIRKWSAFFFLITAQLTFLNSTGL